MAWALAGVAAAAPVAPIVGRWLTQDRQGIIEIYPCADRFCGRLVWMKDPPPSGPPIRDDHNPRPELRHRLLCGLPMLGDFRETRPGHWTDGWIYDPENGKTYHATITLENAGLLHLRGYIGIPLLGETQDWTRAAPDSPSC